MMKSYILCLAMACVGIKGIFAQDTENRFIQFIYAEGEIVTDGRMPLVPQQYYAEHINVKFEGKFVILYDTTYKSAHVFQGNKEGLLVDFVDYAPRTRCECFGCLSTFGEFAQYPSMPYPLLYPDMVLNLEHKNGGGCAREPYELAEGRLLVSEFINTVTGFVASKLHNDKKINLGLNIQKYQADSVAFYIRTAETLKKRGRPFVKRSIVKVDTEALKKMIAPFVNYIKPIYLQANEREKWRMNIQITFRDLLYTIYHGYPDSESLVRWLKEHFDFDLGCHP